MAHPRRDYRYRLRKYPRRRGIIWRWFIFEGGTSSPVETGIILEPDRDKAEAAAKEAIERLRMLPGGFADMVPDGEDTEVAFTRIQGMIDSMTKEERRNPDIIDGNRRRRIAPDVFVVKGVPKGDRLNYLTWEEGKGPDVVIELTSRSTRATTTSSRPGRR